MTDSSTDEPITIPNLVQSVFAEVLEEFRDWKVKYSEHILRSLSLSGGWVPHVTIPIISDSGEIDGNPESDTDTDMEQTQQVAVTSYSEDGTIESTSTISLQVIHARVFEPHAPYESCAPISRNVFKGDDDDRMAFIPFADDETFDHADHSLFYDSLAWQEDYDPDLEVITLEAAYRLHVVHHLLYEVIDSTGVLPFKLFSSPGKPGLFTLSRRRDLFDWKGSIIPRSYNFPSQTPSPGNLRHRLEHVNALFCPNINCMESLCTVHVESNRMPPIRKPTMELSELLNCVRHPCDTGCFLQTSAVGVPPQWSEDDISALKTILEIEPDMIPCDHAELCLKPCHEVLYYRRLLYPGPIEPHIEHPNEENKGKLRTLVFQDDEPLTFTPNEPCYHSGSCGASSNCPCFQNKAHCERNCRCPVKCTRRWKGCRCAKSRNRMSCAKRCPCIEARRECDPELCVKCRCRDPETSSCANSQIQRGHFKELEIKKSQWGLGAFLLEPVKQGDLIVEYVGELIYEETFDSRGEVASHRGRSYVFGLNETLSLDSSYIGNPSRFVDHTGGTASGETQWNCRALLRLVNGEHRIGIFATKDMNSGTEIFIDYGPAFFTNDKIDGS